MDAVAAVLLFQCLDKSIVSHEPSLPPSRSLDLAAVPVSGPGPSICRFWPLRYPMEGPARIGGVMKLTSDPLLTGKLLTVNGRAAAHQDRGR